VSASQALKLFAGCDIETLLRGTKMNSEENALTLSKDAHSYFGDLEAWLEPITTGVCLGFISL